METDKKHPDLTKSNHILISGGDPCGISPEVIKPAIIAWWKHPSRSQTQQIIYFANCPPRYLKPIQDALPPDTVHQIGADDLEQALISSQKLTKYPVLIVDLFERLNESQKAGIKPAQPNILSGQLAFEALELACDWIENYGCRGLLTAPLSKQYIDEYCGKIGLPRFDGHTGYLARRFSADVLMLMHGQRFSVIPLTIHIPLARVSSVLEQYLKDSQLSRLLHDLYQLKVFRQSKWAMCSLNPHAGDGGLLGSEEEAFLNDWCSQRQEEGLPIEGPIAADGLFQSEVLSQYRLVLACYHDQGLIPFKALEGEEGINCTIGLPFLRVSPDHGTAFNIAGQDSANPGSMLQAMQSLIDGELFHWK